MRPSSSCVVVASVLFLCGAAAVLRPAVATAQDAPPVPQPASPAKPAADDPATKAFAAWFDAIAQSDARTAVPAATDAVLALGLSPTAIAERLARGRAFAGDAPKGTVPRTIRAPDGKERPYLVSVPEGYDPARPARLVIDLHGGVSRARHLTHEELRQMDFTWGDVARERNWILVWPAGEQGCVWWDANGSGMVLSILRDVRRTWNVDENDVLLSGFSDGASGSWFFAAAHPTPFAGFVPLSGHPGVAQSGGTQIHLRNYRNRPFYAANTDLDSLYPSAGLKPVFTAMKELGVPVVWRDIAGYRHDPSYLRTERAAIVAWTESVRRDPHPAVVEWEGVPPADASGGRVHWLRVTELAPRRPADAAHFPDVNPVLTDTRIRLGVGADETHSGPGVKVSLVQDGSLAKELGIATGDLLLSIDGAELKGLQGLRAALSKKAPGDDLVVRWRRSGAGVAADASADLEKTLKLPPARQEPAFDRRSPYGSLRAEVRENRFEVTCAGIGAFELLLPSERIDFAKPVRVVVNGTVLHDAVVPEDPRFLLEQSARDEDRTMLYRARLTIRVP